MAAVPWLPELLYNFIASLCFLNQRDGSSFCLTISHASLTKITFEVLAFLDMTM